MKYLLIIVFTILASKELRGQGGVISAPYLEALVTALNSIQSEQSSVQSTMSSVIASMEAGEKQFKEAMTKATWMRNLQACQRLLSMIENLICTSKDLNVKLSISGGNCLYTFKYDMMLVKLQMSADYIGILLSGVSMTVAERAQLFKATAESFEQSQFMMIEMQNSLDADIARSKQLQSVTREVGDFMNFDRSKKRQ